jgi:hydrogenase/urease accessory protein HupE
MKLLRLLAATLCATAAVVLCVPRAVHAHAEPFSWVSVWIEDGGVRGQVTSHVVDAAHALQVAEPDSLLDAAYLQRHCGAFEAAAAGLLQLDFDGRRVVPAWTACRVSPERRAVTLDFEVAGAPPARVLYSGPLYTWEQGHETYFNLYRNGQLAHQDLIDAGRPRSVYDTGLLQSRTSVIRRFLLEGVHHIFIGPDHILFVVGLLLLGGKVRRLLKIVTAFTIAHSITLALAATGRVTPPASIVEPLIALSIVYVGVENLLRGRHAGDRRVWIAATFGLVHGFGFASVLRELGLPREALAWSLFAFNAGVEVGQMCIVLAVAPLLGLLHARRPELALRAVTAGSTLVIAAGTYWFVQRTFLS